MAAGCEGRNLVPDGNDAGAFAGRSGQYFRIDKATGPDLREEGPQLRGHAGVANGEYTIVVRATDPSGETTSCGVNEKYRDDIVVERLVATDVNEAPSVKGPGLVELDHRR